jgi:FkbM family methyltransferase
MPKNISHFEDARANLRLPITQFTDIKNIIKNKSFVSKLGNVTQIYLGKVKVTRFSEKSNQDKGHLKFKYKGRDILLYYDSKERLATTLGMIEDEFIKEESVLFNVKKREVVDVGAYVADTAIAYIANGAKHVYALEPYPYYYNLGVKNIALNKLGGKITMINAGCGGEDSRTSIDKSSTSFTSIKKSNSKKSAGQIKIISLKHLAKQYGLKNAALKIDCEGCEYDIMFKTDKDILRRFSEIQIEYHYGYKNLEKRLKEIGFNVKISKPVKKYNFTTRSFMVLGFINAKRI